METVRTTLRAEDIANYDDQIAREKSHFEADRYNPATLVEHITSALDRSHEAFDHKVQKALGHQPWEYIISRVNAKPHPRVLSIGSGPCGV